MDILLTELLRLSELGQPIVLVLAAAIVGYVLLTLTPRTVLAIVTGAVVAVTMTYVAVSMVGMAVPEALLPSAAMFGGVMGLVTLR